jgi:hypothetical protein
VARVLERAKWSNRREGRSLAPIQTEHIFANRYRNEAITLAGKKIAEGKNFNPPLV